MPERVAVGEAARGMAFAGYHTAVLAVWGRPEWPDSRITRNVWLVTNQHCWTAYRGGPDW